MAVSVLPEGFFAGLLPAKVVELDSTGVMQALLSGFQDRTEDLRAYVSDISALIDPFAGTPIEGTCVSVTYTDNYGLVVTRTVLGRDLESDAKYQALVSGTLSQADAKVWMGEVLTLDSANIDIVEIAVDPFKTVYQPMIGYLADSIGAIFPTSNTADSRNSDIVASHFSRLPIKGTSRAIEIAGLLAGFDSVHVSPLWGRLSARQPSDVGDSFNNLDFSETAAIEPTIEPSEFYDPLSYRDGPFYTWSSVLGLLNGPNFISQANQAGPYVKWRINGVEQTNFRGIFNTASTYSAHDVVVALTGRTFMALVTTAVTPPTTFLDAQFVMPDVDSTVSITVRDPSWMTSGAEVSIEGAGQLRVDSISGVTVVLTNRGANGNAAVGTIIPAGKVMVGIGSEIWLEVALPSPGIYPLAGGGSNVEATAQLTSVLSVAGLSEGESFNGLEIVVEATPTTLSSLTTTTMNPRLVTAVTPVAHDLASGDYVVVSNVAPMDYIGLWEVVVVDATTFQYTLPTNIYAVGAPADGGTLTYSRQEFIATIFDRLSSIKYRTSYYNLALAIQESTSDARAVPARPNLDIVQGVKDGSIVASPPYLPFTTGGIGVDGTTPQVDTTWLTNLAAEADVILESVKPATRFTRGFSSGILYEDTFGYAAYVDESLMFDALSPTSGTLGGPIYPRLANARVKRYLFPYYFYRVQSSGSDAPTLSISLAMVITFPAVIGRTYTIQAKVGIMDPWFQAAAPIIATTNIIKYQVAAYDELDLVGESNATNPDVIQFSGTASYGAVEVTLDTRTGVFTGTKPVLFPANAYVVAEWVVTDSGTIRTEPTLIEKMAGTLGFLSRPEDEFGTTTHGSRPNLYPDVSVWLRPIEREVLNRDVEPVYGEAQVSPGAFVPTVTSHEGVNYALNFVDSQYPFKTRVTELGQRNQIPTLAYSGTSLYYVGLRYGQLLACPERTFSKRIQAGLDAWIPFNAHAEDDLHINCVYPVERRLRTSDLRPENRVWDSARGWVTHMKGATTTLTTATFLSELTLTFWFKPVAWTTTWPILGLGPIVLEFDGATSLSLYYSGVLVGTVAPTDFSFISVRQQADTILFGLNGVETAYSITAIQYAFDNLILASEATTAEYHIQDLKLWTTFKTAADIVEFYAPTLVSTKLATLPTAVELASTGDRWFLYVLASGFVAASIQPESTIVEVADQFNSLSGGVTTTTSLGTITKYFGNALAVSNYDAKGRYIADSSRKLVGIPGGTLPPLPRTLGQAFYPIDAVNQAAVSPVAGLPSGINPLWLNDTSVGDIRVSEAPFSSVGGVDTTVPTGIASEWPNRATSTNPIVDRIWIEGDSGTIYEVQVGGPASPTFVTSPVFNPFTKERASGAVTVLTDGANVISVHASGTLYTTSTVDTLTPTTYLYRHDYRFLSYTGNQGWIPTESSELYDGSPALASSGQLIWSENAATLAIGHYRLRITAHNAGQSNNDFNGFDVEAVIGQNITFPMVLSPASTIEETAYDFHVETAISAPWLVQVFWRGLVNDPARGISYKLVVDQVCIDRLTTQAYSVDVGPSLTAVVTTAPNTTALSDLPPGGWLAAISSNGTIAAWTHEALVRPSVGGQEASTTLANSLAASTENKISHIVLSPDYAASTVLPDPAAPTPPAISSFSVVVDPATVPVQVGYEVTIAVVATGAIAYVWRFWDGSKETTYAPTITKIINKGGLLTWSCRAIDAYGQSDAVSDSIPVNAPPIIQTVSLTNNDLPPVYSTDLTATVSDPDSGAPLLVWLTGEIPIVVSTLDSGTTQGTAVFTLSVATSETHVIHVVDGDGGTTLLDVDVRATTAKPLIVATTVVPRSQRIGPTTSVRLICRATEPNGGSTPTFAWTFLEENGWVLTDFASVSGFTPVYDPFPTIVGYACAGVTQSLSGNVYQNSVLVPVLTNQVGGKRLVEITVTPTIGSPVTNSVDVILIPNTAPVIERFNIVSPELVVASLPVTIEAITADAENDLIAYSWNMEDCSDPVYVGLQSNPITITPNTAVPHGTLTVSDAFGGVSVAAIPPVIISSRVTVEGSVGQPLVYVPRAMSATTAYFTFGFIPPGLTIVNGTVLGVPLVAATTETTLSAVSASGADTRVLVWIINPSAASPLSPDNLVVNGDGNNPRYSTGQDLVIQWTITNDSGAIPGSIVELRKFDGTLVETIEVASGVNILVVTDAQIVNAFTTYQDIVVRVYSFRNSARSVLPAETIVTYVY